MIDTTPQYVGTNLQGRSVILDAKCILSGGKQINIEVKKQMMITVKKEYDTMEQF